MIVFPILLGAGLIGSIVKFVHHRRNKNQNNQVIETNMDSVLLIINGSTHRFPYENNKTKRMELAMQFCSAQGETLGFTMQTFQSCVNPITAQLDAKMRVEGPVGGSDYTGDNGSEGQKGRTEYEVLEDDAKIINAKIVKAETIAEEEVVDGTDDGSNAVKEGVTVEDHKLVNMDINGMNYSFQYPPSLGQEAAAQSMADQFCREHAAEIGINLLETTDEALAQTCTTPLASGLLKTMKANE